MSRAFTKERDDAPPPEPVLVPRRRTADTPAPPSDRRLVGYGARVVVEGVGPEPKTFTIADEDETDLAAGKIGLDSPLAQALIGARAGAKVTWHRPAGDRRLKVVSVKYDDLA
jgi:transcription elongation factor GreB